MAVFVTAKSVLIYWSLGQINFLRPDITGSNFKETIVGGILTNTWIYVEGLDRQKGLFRKHSPLGEGSLYSWSPVKQD